MWPALFLAADLATSFAVSDRTELRVRAPGTASAAASFDAETTLTARLGAASRRWRFALGYLPRLTLWDANSSTPQLTLLHGGEARLEWLGRQTRLALDQTASYGGVSFASFSLAPGPEGQPPRVDFIPGPQILELVSSTTTLSSHVLWRRWTLDTSAGYQLAGGADAGSRALLPLQAGPFGEARATFGITRKDFVLTTLSAKEASFSSGPESVLVELDEGYRHRWSRITETRLTLGASAARVRTSSIGGAMARAYPVVEAVYERREAGESHLGVLLGARLGPVINPLIGLVDQRVQGTLAASHTHRRLATKLFLSASQSVPPNGVNATSLLAGELGVAYGATRAVALDAGFRGFWQRQEASGASFLQATAFVGVTLRAPPMRL